MANKRVGSKKYMSASDAPDAVALGPYGYAFAIVPNDATRFDATRGIFATAAGTANVVFEGEIIVPSFPLVVGENKLRLIGVKTGGTATGIFGAY